MDKLPTFPNSLQEGDTAIDLLMDNGSYLMYEFKDTDLDYDYHGQSYLKKISPLFSNEVIDAPYNKHLLCSITDNIPYYYIEPMDEPDSSMKYILNQTRDPHKLYVPSPMHNSFWNTYLSEGLGDINNNILLSVYNKLRFPFINENQYLNAELFPKLANLSYSEGSDENFNKKVNFKYTEEDNLEDIKNGEIGCIDYLNGIVEEKLGSTYAIIDYNPDQSVLLSDWCDTLYLSGRLPYSEIPREKSVFKLQDLKYELLRRKFAGSSTLYKLALASVDRQGSFVGLVTAGKLNLDHNDGVVIKSFRDKRLIRTLNLPGLLSSIVDMSNNNPLKVYYDIPLSENKNYIPLSIASPLFYTSGIQSEKYSAEQYNAEKFYIGEVSENSDFKLDKYRSTFLRDNSSVIPWDTPTGILSSKTIRSTYPKLDEKDPYNEKMYRRMDFPYDTPGEFPVHYEIIALDIKTPLLSTTSSSGSCLDINTNRILYHKNSIQKNLGDLYPFVTYPIANGNSLSLMDTSWMYYMKSSTERKSRVQDNVLFGAQASHYVNFTGSQTAEYNFFGISYDCKDSQNINFESNLYDYNDVINVYGRPPRFAYIWHVTVVYYPADFRIKDISLNMVTKIALQISEQGGYSRDEVNILKEKYKDSSSFNELLTYNRGPLPFTYNNLRNGVLNNLNYGIYNNNYIDDLENSIYEKCYYLFSENDTIVNVENSFASSQDVDNVDPKNTPTGLQKLPTSNTKAFFFIVYRNEPDENNEIVGKFKWSESIKVTPINTSFYKYLKHKNNIKDELDNFGEPYFTTDWYKLGYHLNPYLNFTKNSASSLRHKSSLPSYSTQSIDIKEDSLKELLIGPSIFIGLSNLACSRRQDYLRNDNGLTSEFKDELKPIIGSYLERITYAADDPKYTKYNREYVRVYGDNRTKDLYDSATSSDVETTNLNRSEIAVDKNSLYSINFELGNSTSKPAGMYTDICPNVFRLSPFNIEKYSDSDGNVYEDKEHNVKLSYSLRDIYHNWWFNKPSNGNTICLNLRFDPNILFEPTITDRINLVSREDSQKEGINTDFKLYLRKNNEDSYTFVYEMYPLGTNSFKYSIESKDYSFKEITGYVEKKSRKRKLTAESINDLTKDPSNIRNFRIAASTFAKEKKEGPNKSDIYSNLIISLIINNDLYFKDYKIKYNETDNIELYELKDNKYVKDDSLSSELDVSFKSSTYVVRDDFELSEEPEVYLPIYPVKFNKDDTNNNLGSITLLSNYEINDENQIVQKDIFLGNLYDFRVYNTGFNPYSLKIISSGILRELYSYTPSSFKLSYSIYKDFGIFKRIDQVTEMPNIKTVRIFNRSVWDSILVDMHPLTPEEKDTSSLQYVDYYMDPQDDTDVYKDGESVAVSQDLINPAELINAFNPQDSGVDRLIINYRGENHFVEKEDDITVVTTMLYPVDYKNHKFSGGAKLVVKSSSDNSVFTTEASDIKLPGSEEVLSGKRIKIPARATGNTLRYYGDLGLNFKIGIDSDFSTFFSRGSNIDLVYSEKTNSSVINLKNATVRDSDKNHVLSYFTIPRRYDISSSFYGYLDRLYISNFQLSSVFNTLLNSESYYSELRVPYATQFDLNKNVELYSRWHAIRNLKEGSYFITCKYPLQIMPFMDYDYNTSLTSKYLTVYGTVRFKIEVIGTPQHYDSDNFKITGYPEEFMKENIKEEISSGRSIYRPTDNSSYPHRKVIINLYVMTCSNVAGLMNNDEENYSYNWDLIASNDENKVNNTGNKVKLLNSELLSQPIFINKEIPIFFSKNYMTPFFICKYTKGGNPDPTSADDDLISPIKIMPFINKSALEEETLIVQNENDMDNIKVVAGKSYKVLLDYTGKITEFSFTDTIFESAEIGVEEKTIYNRMYNLLDSQKDISEYMYNLYSPWYTLNDSNINTHTSGYGIDENNKWIEIGEDNNKYYLGNPYSRSSDLNYLLQKTQEYRKNTNSLNSFPYICDNFYERAILPSSYIMSLPVVEAVGGVGAYTLSRINDFNELKVLRDLTSQLRENILSSIDRLSTQSYGVFSKLSTFKPNITYGTAEENVVNFDSIKSNEYDLYVFTASDRYIPNKNPGVLLYRRGLYSNNLIISQSFNDLKTYHMSVLGKYVSDNDWNDGEGKDVYKFNLTSDSNVNRIEYMGSLGFSKIKAQFETAINIKSTDINNLELYACYMLQNKEVKRIQLTSAVEGEARALLDNNKWYVFSHDIEEAIEIDRIVFEIKYVGDSNCDIYITKLVLRKSNFINHYLGLSNVVYNVSASDSNSKVLCYSHNIMLFKHKLDATIVPIRMLNNIKSYNSSNDYGSVATAHYVDSGLKRIADFVNNYSLDSSSTSKMKKMFKPWLRKVQYWESYESTISEEILNDKGEKETIYKKVLLPNKVNFYNYRIAIDSNGIRSAQQLKTPINDIFEASNKYDAEGNVVEYAFDYIDATSEIAINSLKVLTNNGYLKEFKTNLEIDLSDPITFEEERFTLLSNCFNPERYKKGLNTPVAVTNIQLLSPKKEGEQYDHIEYEYEYIPIIYDELEHHLSLNLFIHQSN